MLIFSFGFFLGAIVFIAASIVIAWSGPTQSAPNANVSAPINVGTTDQIKDAGLGLNALAVFGNAILSGTSRHLNFGDSAGEGGYGIRDNAGTMEFRNSGGSWRSFLPSTGVQSITFADGTTQTTAGGSITDMCLWGDNTPNCNCSGCSGGATGWTLLGCWDVEAGPNQGRPSVAGAMTDPGAWNVNLCIK